MTTDQLREVQRIAHATAYAITGCMAYAGDDRFEDAGVDGYLKARRTWNPERGPWKKRLTRCIRDEIVGALVRHTEQILRERRVSLTEARMVPAADRRLVDFDALDCLPMPEKRVARDVLLEGRSVPEAAERGNVSPRTAFYNLASARRRLAVAYAG